MNFPRARRQIRKVQKGFTLIELMIVVAIIGILAAVAIPQYQDYVSRSRWASAVAALSGVQQAVGQCLQDKSGDIAQCNTTTKLNTAGFLRDDKMPTAPTSAGIATQPAFSGNAITMVGKDGCTIKMSPDVTTNKNALTWSIEATGTNASGDDCGKTNTGFDKSA